ncbi:MAG: hypothetical protein AAGA66_05395 [Bacteroidota bacterium]
MKNRAIILLIFFCYACTQRESGNKVKKERKVTYRQVPTPGYQLEKPIGKPNAVLILFGGYPEVAEDIKREFQILDKAKENEIAVVFSNYNKTLWFEANELNDLAKKLRKIFTDHLLPNDHVFFGGFSSGGIVALLLSDYLIKNQEIGLVPKGIFIVDTPVDLTHLYISSEKKLNGSFSEPSLLESMWLVDVLGNRFGNPHEDISEYEKHSVFILKTGRISNIENLKKTKIRMYTEPDTLWWKENSMADYEQMNAYAIKKLSEKLKGSGFSNVEYIPTKNRGYRANGQRHPHSWSIVEINDLIKWLLDSA